MGVRWAFWVSVAAMAQGCGDPEVERERREAEALLAQIAAIDVDADPKEREPHVKALEALPLSAPALEETRRVCVRAHRALLEAERAQAEAKALLDGASGGAVDTSLSAAQEVGIGLAIERSNAALSRARALLPECETARTGLRVRRPRP